MKIKLDENLGSRGAHILRAAGHDVKTVPEQEMSSAADQAVISTCKEEKRCLVTLDLDFGNPLLFRPSKYEGIAVLRLPARTSATDLHLAIQTLVEGLKSGDIRGKLWIVQVPRIREYQEE